jgi:hypothetical protein
MWYSEINRIPYEGLLVTVKSEAIPVTGRGGL